MSDCVEIIPADWLNTFVAKRNMPWDSYSL